MNIKRGWRLSNLLGNINLHFKKHRHAIQILDLTFQDGSSRIHGEGVVPLEKDREFRLHLESTIDSSHIIKPLLRKDVSLSGLINIAGNLTGELQNPIFEGDLSIPKWLFNKMEGEELKSHITIKKNEFTIDDLKGASLGGTFQGSLRGSFAAHQNLIDLALQINAMDLHRISRFFEKFEWRFHGLASGRANIRMNVTPWRLLDGEIKIDIQKKKSEEVITGRNIEGEILATISGGEIILKKSIIRSDTTVVKAQGTVYPLEKNHVTFNLNSAAIQDEILFLEPLMIKIKKDHLRERLKESLAGVLHLTGETGWDDDFNLKCDADFSNLSLFQNNWGDVSGTLTVQGKKLTCQSVQWGGPQGSGLLSGFIMMKRPLEYQWQGEARDLPIESLLPLLNKKIDTKGISTFSFSLMSHEGKLQGTLSGEIHDGEIFREKFGAAHGKVEIDRRTMRFLDWSIQKGESTAFFNGEYKMDEKWLEMAFEGAGLKASDLSLIKKNHVEMGGQWNFKGHTIVRSGKIKAICEAHSENFSLGPIKVGPVSMKLEVDHPYLFYSVFPKEWNANFSGAIQLDRDLPFEGTLEFNKTDYSFLKPLMKLESAELSGNLSGKASYKGELKKMKEITIRGEITDFEIQAAQRIYKNVSPVAVHYASGTLQANDLFVTGDNTELAVDILINVEQDRMSLNLYGNFDLNIVDTFAKNISSSGKGTIQATADGPFLNPNIEGEVKIRHGTIRHFSLPYPIENLSLDGYFDRDFLVLPSIHFDFARGKAQGNGIVSIKKLGYDAYSLELSGKDIAMKFPAGMKYYCDPALLIRGDRSGAIISGDVSIIRGLYFKDFNLESGIMSFKSREYQPFAAQEMPENIFLDLDIQIEEGFWVKNDLANAELRGHLHVGGDINRVELTGRLSALEAGTFELRGVEYEIMTAHIDFADPTRIFPSFDITARTEVSDYEIELRATGDVEKFEYHLTSDPVLPTRDIVALLMTGTTFQALEEKDHSTMTGDLAASYLAGSYTRKLEKKLQEELRLEKVQIDPMLVKGQTDPTARLTLGKKLSDQLMFIYSNSLDDSEKNVYQMDYRIRKNLSFLAERTELGAIAGSLSHRTHLTLQKDSEKAKQEKEQQKIEKTSSRVADIIIKTEHLLSQKKLLKKLPLRKGKPYQRKLVLEGSEKLKIYLIKKGFLQAFVKNQVEKADEGYYIYYDIQEGEKIDIHLEGISKKEDKKIRKRISSLAAESIFPQELTLDIETMIEGYFREKGYYTVDVFMEEVEHESRREVTFSIDKGDQVSIEKIMISGNKVFDEERIFKQMLIDEGTLFGQTTLKPSILQEDILAIENLYRENGYGLVKIENPVIILSADGKKANVRILINEGPLVLIQEVQFQGQESIPVEELYQKISSYREKPFVPSHVRRDELVLQQYYDSKGFPDARVSSRITFDDAFANLHFQISEGKKKKVGEVTITGNEITKEKIIRRELLFQPGEDLSKDALLRSQHNLYKLGVFKKVSIDRIPSLEPERDNINVSLEEADNIHFSYGGGFDNQSGPRGFFEISDTNFIGYDRFVSLLLRASDEDRRAQIILKEPRLFTRKLDTIYSTYWKREVKEGYTNETTATTFQVEKKWTPKLRSYFNYQYENVELSDVTISLKELREDDPRLQDIKLSSVGFNLLHDARDDPFNPKKGTYASMHWQVYYSAIGSEADFVKTYLQGSHFKNYGKNIVLASSIRLGASNTFSDTEAVPLSERFFAGGDSTIRGFDRDEVGPKDPVTGDPVGGEAVFLINEELRFPLFENFMGVLFYDTGNVYFHLEDLDPFELRHVVGVGFRVKTPIGPLRFEYGRKLDREEGESGGRFFVSIGQPF